METVKRFIKRLIPFVNDDFSFAQADKRMFRYLVFCFILAIDSEALKQLFESEVESIENKFMWISIDDIRYYETLLHNGILESKHYKTIFDAAARKLVAIPAATSKGFNDKIKNIHFLELACVLKSDNGCTDLIPVLVSCSNMLDLKTIQEIIKNPNVDSKAVGAIICSIAMQKFDLNWPNWVY